MENIRRKIRLFFATYGSLLFQIIGLIVIVLFSLNMANELYTESSNESINLEGEYTYQQEKLQNEEDNKKVISQFLEYCNNNQIELAYSMLSEACINEKYKTIDSFKTEYIDKIFTHKKEYIIEKENDLYKITIMDGILESGSLENRNSLINYYKIEENVLNKTIYIEKGIN